MRVALPIAVAVLALAACGSGGGDTSRSSLERVLLRTSVSVCSDLPRRSPPSRAASGCATYAAKTVRCSGAGVRHGARTFFHCELAYGRAADGTPPPRPDDFCAAADGARYVAAPRRICD